MVEFGLSVKTLEEECALSDVEQKRVQRKHIRRAVEGKPINYIQAIGIIEALERRRAEGKSTSGLPPLIEDEVIVGALFYLDEFDNICDTHHIEKKDIVDGLRVLHPAVDKWEIDGTIDQLLAGNRVTLPLALDVVKVLNGILRARKGTTLDPREVITANNDNKRRAPCNWQILKTGPYAEWPPTPGTPLRPEDEPEQQDKNS